MAPDSQTAHMTSMHSPSQFEAKREWSRSAALAFDPDRYRSAMVMAFMARMRVRFDRLVKLVCIDLQSEHSLNIFARLCHVVWSVVAHVHHMFEPMLHLLPHRVGKKADQRVRRAVLDGLLGDRDNRPLVRSCRLETRIRSAFSSAMDAHHRLKEIEIGETPLAGT